ncbi:MAG: hypothetical protein GY768_29255, partial [Planctomycetaceae bacterium]|nr:hypothetical protein [Planctomycetaceae bacterium]
MGQFFRTQPDIGAVYSIVDLTQLAYPGDARMADFRFHWETLLEQSATRDNLSDRTLEEILVEKLSHSKVMQEDIQHYYRQELGHPDRSSTFLRRCLDRHIDRTQQERNRAARSQMMSKVKAMQPLAAPAVSTPAKAKPKPKAGPGDAANPPPQTEAKAKGTSDAGGKAKGKGRSQSPAQPKNPEGVPFCWFHHHSPGG